MSRALASFSKREFNVGNPYNAVGEAEKPGKKEVIRGLARAGSCDQPRDYTNKKRGGAVTRAQEMDSARGGWNYGWVALERCSHQEKSHCPARPGSTEKTQGLPQPKAEAEGRGEAPQPLPLPCPPISLQGLLLAEPSQSPNVCRV